MESINCTFCTKIYSISLRAVIKLTEKKDRNEQYIKTWRSISLLNIDTKNLPYAIFNKLKAVLPTGSFSQHTAYVKNRFIGKRDRVVSNIIEIRDLV